MTGFRTPDEWSGSPLATELLELARSEQASTDVREHAAQAGLRAVSGAGVAAGATASWFAGGLAAKLGATVGLLVGVGLWSFAATLRRGEPSSGARVAESSARPAGSARPVVTSGASSGSSVSAPTDELAEARKVPSARALDSSSSAARRDDLGREIALLDRARALLRAGDAKGAVRVVEGQRLRILGPEAQALKVEALIASGDAIRARKLATQFLERYPASPLARRVDELRQSVAAPSAERQSNSEEREP